MVVFVFIVIAVIVVIIVVRNKKRDEKVKFLLNESASHYVAVKIRDALVKEGYEVSEKPSIVFYGRFPRGDFVVSKGDQDEYGFIYFCSVHGEMDMEKSLWKSYCLRVIRGHLYAAEIADIGLLVISLPPRFSYAKGRKRNENTGYDEIPQFIEIAARIMADSGLEYEIVRKANSSVDDD
jgi:hypothetical protein